MIENYFTTPFYVYRVSSSVNSDNDVIETMVLYSSNRGYIEPVSGRERFFSDKWHAYTTHKLFCPVIDVTEKDEIHINSEIYKIDWAANYNNHHMENILILEK